MDRFISKKGMELIKTREVFESARGTFLETTLKEEVIKNYSEEMFNNMIELSVKEFSNHIKENDVISDEELISCIEDFISDKFTVSIVGSSIHLVKELYFKDNNIIKLLEFLEERGLEGVDCLSLFVKKYHNQFSKNNANIDVLTCNEDRITIVCSVRKDLIDKTILTKKCDLIEDFEEKFIESLNINSVSNDVQIIILDEKYNLCANNYLAINLYSKNLEFMPKNDSEYIALLSKYFSKAVSKHIASKSSSICDYLQRYSNKFAATEEDINYYRSLEKLSEVKEYIKRNIISEINTYINFNVDIEKNIILFNKPISIDLSRAKNYDVSFFNSEKEKYNFLVNVIKSKLLNSITNHFGEDSINKEEFLNSFVLTDNNLKLEINLVLKSLDYFSDRKRRNDFIGYFSKVYYRTTIV